MTKSATRLPKTSQKKQPVKTKRSNMRTHQACRSLDRTDLRPCEVRPFSLATPQQQAAPTDKSFLSENQSTRAKFRIESCTAFWAFLVVNVANRGPPTNGIGNWSSGFWLHPALVSQVVPWPEPRIRGRPLQGRRDHPLPGAFRVSGYRSRSVTIGLPCPRKDNQRLFPRPFHPVKRSNC